MFDKRLIGTWRSDRRKTFLHYKPKIGTTPQNLRKLKGIFGKFVIRWARTKYHTVIDGYSESAKYEIVAKDADSVIIRHFDEVRGRECLIQIHFEDDCYWIPLSGQLIEWFRRVKESK